MSAFVGITAEASTKRIDPETGERIPVQSLINRATLVTNWTQYQNVFGGFVSGAYTPDAVYGYFNNGGGACYVVSIKALNEDSDSATAASVTVPGATAKSKGLTVTAKVAGEGGNDFSVTIKTEDEKAGTFTMTVGTESKSGLTLKKGDGFVGDADFAAVTISDVGTAVADGTYQLEGGGFAPLKAMDYIGDVVKRTGLAGLDAA